MADECIHIDQIRLATDTRGTFGGGKLGDGGRQRILLGNGVDCNLAPQLREAPSGRECRPETLSLRTRAPLLLLARSNEE